jgi:hypothetical protein
MHGALARLLADYERSLSFSTQEAMAAAEKSLVREEERAMKVPPERTTWLHLRALAQRDPEAAAQRWTDIEKAALDELQSGHRAALTMLAASPWERAQYLAIRRALAQDWQPRGGLELQLIETLAQAQVAWHFWLEATIRWATNGAERSGRACQDDMGRPTPRLSEGEAIERAGAMADRFNRIFLRTLRALRDLRRQGPAVLVQNVSQVNVNSQQISTRNGDRDPPEKRETHTATPGACHCQADRRHLLGGSM